MNLNDSRRLSKQLPFTSGRQRPPLRDWRRMALAAGLTAWCGAFFSGCSTSKPASASFASVVIAHQPVQKIQETTVFQFQEAGYEAKPATVGKMIFEKEGSRGQQMAYGGLGGVAYGGAVTVRVRAEIVDLVGQDAKRLQCKAYIVNSAGDGVFDDEQPLANFRRGPYQKLLDEVAAKLK
jgi:hypothetical protein